LSYLCTKVLESDYQDDFQSTQAFLANCNDQEYNHNALMCASELSTQQRLPWSKTCYTLQDKIISNYKPTSKETMTYPQSNKSDVEAKPAVVYASGSPKPNDPFQFGGTYLTQKGKPVTLSPRNGAAGSRMFIGSNSYYYTAGGKLYDKGSSEYDLLPLCSKDDEVREAQDRNGLARVTPKESMSKFYTEQEVQQMLTEVYQNGINAGDSLSTSEIQSLITQQSKVIFELECEISELKELTSYLGMRSYIPEVQDLRKAVFNKMTTKQKRLGKLVSLQIKLKRSK
jgi:hypothetical protein